MLKGMFITDQEFVKGQVFHFDGYDFSVIGIENSSKRVRFNITQAVGVIDEGATTTPEPLGTLSLSREALTNSREAFAYKKGDTVVLLEDPEVKYPVVGINPASRNVVLNMFGKLRYVKISKVKLAGEDALDAPRVPSE